MYIEIRFLAFRKYMFYNQGKYTQDIGLTMLNTNKH